uniref:Reverse transcriptase domain-containing protein n=1 Tax=Tanacetum cinerariifolium TaxID=118510 RepID=A0A6L2MLE6_TANCI|nr:reverse transcriptase domain-containing protein [Tanacetum cinerariifolium]
MSKSPEPRRGHSESPRKKGPERKLVFKRLEKGVFHRLGDKGKSMSSYSNDSRHRLYHSSRKDTKRYTRVLVQEKQSLFLKNIITKGHPHKGWNRCQKVKVAQEGIGSQSKIGKSRVLRTICPNHGDVKGAPERMKISGVMHGITNPELIKRLHDKILKSVDEMMRVTTTFLRGEVAASNHKRKKSFSLWKQQKAAQKQNFKKGGFQNQQRQERKQDRFTLLTKTPTEILALDKGKFKPLSPMTTPVEKRNASKFYEFHGEVGEEDETEGPMIIEAEMGGHFVYRMYVDRVSSLEILKVVIPIQRNHKKARNKENTGSSIYSSRNAKISSNRQNDHITEHRDYSIRMHNGFKTRSAAACNQPSHRRKNPGRDSLRISETNYSNMLYFHRRMTEGAMRPAKAQPRYIRLEANGYDWSSTSHSRARSKYS